MEQDRIFERMVEIYERVVKQNDECEIVFETSSDKVREVYTDLENLCIGFYMDTTEDEIVFSGIDGDYLVVLATIAESWNPKDRLMVHNLDNGKCERM